MAVYCILHTGFINYIHYKERALYYASQYFFSFNKCFYHLYNSSILINCISIIRPNRFYLVDYSSAQLKNKKTRKQTKCIFRPTVVVHQVVYCTEVSSPVRCNSRVANKDTFKVHENNSLILFCILLYLFLLLVIFLNLLYCY